MSTLKVNYLKNIAETAILEVSKLFERESNVIAYAASITPDLDNGNIINVGILTNDIIINAPINMRDDDILTIRLTQDGTGGRSVTWDAAFTVTTEIAKASSVPTVWIFWYDGSNWIEISPIKGQELQSLDIAYALTINPDLNTASFYNIGALTGNITIGASTNMTRDDLLTVSMVQDATGNRTVTWDGLFLVSTSISLRPSKRTVWNFWYNGTSWIEVSATADYDSDFKTFTANDGTPSVLGHNLWKTNNGIATILEDFDDGIEGQEITVIIDDSNTTVDFTDDSIGDNLRGNGGADWSPSDGDLMKCIYEGTIWYCNVIDTTL